MKDLYAVLGVSKTATKDEIVKAYRKGAQTHHPDKNPGDPEAESRFRDIQEAYEVLNDPTKRAEYDAGGSSMNFRNRRPQGFDSGFSAPFGDMMNDFFGNSSFRGRNLTIRLEISLFEAYVGVKKEITIKKKDFCNTCKGKGQVSNENCGNCAGQGFVKVHNAPFEFRTQCSVCKGLGKINPIPCSDCNATGKNSEIKDKKIIVDIPCGIESGMNIKINGEGEESIQGGRTGDLIVHVLIKEHECFGRDGVDLLLDVPVTYSMLCLGCSIELPTISGEKVIITVPEGTQSQTKFKLRGKGLALPNGIIGDMIVTVKIEIPRKINDEYKESVKKLIQQEAVNLGERRKQWHKIMTENNK